MNRPRTLVLAAVAVDRRARRRARSPLGGPGSRRPRRACSRASSPVSTQPAPARSRSRPDAASTSRASPAGRCPDEREVADPLPDRPRRPRAARRRPRERRALAEGFRKAAGRRERRPTSTGDEAPRRRAGATSGSSCLPTTRSSRKPSRGPTRRRCVSIRTSGPPGRLDADPEPPRRDLPREILGGPRGSGSRRASGPRGLPPRDPLGHGSSGRTTRRSSRTSSASRASAIGAEQLYALAARRGDQPLMLAAAIVQGEAPPQRLRTAQLLTAPERPDGRQERRHRQEGRRPDRRREGFADRRFRSEAIVMLAFARLAARVPEPKRPRARSSS